MAGSACAESRPHGAQLFPRPGIGLSGVEVGEPVQLTLSSVDLSTDLRALLNRRDRRCDVGDLRQHHSDAAAVRHSRHRRLRHRTSRRQQAGSRSFRSGRSRCVTSRSAVADAKCASRQIRRSTGSHLTLERFTAESGQHVSSSEGEAELEPRVDAKLQAKANKIDIDELLALAEAFTPERRASATHCAAEADEGRRADISADTATAAGVQVTQFTARACRSTAIASRCRR